MLDYPIELTPDDNGTLLVTCPLLPEVTTFGESETEAWRHAQEAIEEAIGARLARWDAVPLPDGSVDRGVSDRKVSSVRLPLLTEMKVLLFRACRDAGVSRAELARRLDWHREQVDRLFRVDHASRVDQFDAAFAALKSDLKIEVGHAA